MLHFESPDMTGVFPSWGIPAALVLWTILLIIVLFSWRRTTVKRRRQAQEAKRLGMRESWIAKENAKDDEKYLKSLPKTIKNYQP